ncbi:MAG: hypothetical protein J0H75_07570, partial [Rhizobiales bacterium]|nr:hypothetical protein [Hyphomicrobiales bacterium]
MANQTLQRGAQRDGGDRDRPRIRQGFERHIQTVAKTFGNADRNARVENDLRPAVRDMANRIFQRSMNG